MNYLLTKSKFIRGLQCHKALYLDVYHREVGKISAETKMKFIKGRSFESTYKATFPTAIDISKRLGKRIDSYPTLTAELLANEGEVILFEAGFKYNDVLVLADVVKKLPNGHLIIHEVKGGSKISETYQRDIAIQYYVISQCCPHIDAFCIVHNDGNDGFVIEDQLSYAQSQQPTIQQQVIEMKQVLTSGEPLIEMGDQCNNPYECPYQDYCKGKVSAQLDLPF